MNSKLKKLNKRKLKTAIRREYASLVLNLWAKYVGQVNTEELRKDMVTVALNATEEFFKKYNNISLTFKQKKSVVNPEGFGTYKLKISL